uniref:Uncharacterized protein n=1 Tax=Human herpesvirus 2 TaxID=10310 RepID=A0A481TNN7_HHV2|nr:hypothetical protein [Human alphaherpesvirus 2]QBH82800.1 hypothetical protein [Human alphaherpesvirus 2]
MTTLPTARPKSPIPSKNAHSPANMAALASARMTVSMSAKRRSCSWLRRWTSV